MGSFKKFKIGQQQINNKNGSSEKKNIKDKKR